MRMLALPAALLLACCLYLPLPRAREAIARALDGLYALVLRLFTRKNGQTDDAPALLMYLLLLGGVSALLCAVHPLLSAVLAAPLFDGLAPLPQCARVKDELDSGKYAKDIPAYEALVRKTCASLAPAFVGGVIAPMLLCAVGMPLYLGCAPGWILAALMRRRADSPAADRIAKAALRISESVFCAMLLLCSGVVGRNPLRTQGRGAQDRLMNILGIAGNASDTHAPMAGDIPQGVFLCGFISVLLCAVLTLLGLALC